ncbi:MAG: hypothetical protein ACLQNE_39130 [Thermoguttaceae bacterium]|jgi:hypothetical protein
MAKKTTKKVEQPKTTAWQLGTLVKSARDIMRKDSHIARGLSPSTGGIMGVFCGTTDYQSSLVGGKSSPTLPGG